MRFSIYASPRSGHQMPSAQALKLGLEKHGHEVQLTHGEIPPDAEVAVVWGWRAGRLMKKARPSLEILVMERSYIKDRFHWTSFGWNGLNGNAGFFVPTDRPERWQAFFADQIKPARTGGEYALLLGQVQGDASLVTCPDVDNWYQQVHHRFTSAGVPVFFRDHPKAKGPWAPHLPRMAGALDQALAGASCVIAWNSNGLVDAALAGVPIFAGCGGTMAFPIANDMGTPTRFRNFNRQKWAEDLAWTQWTLPEVASGDAIEIILAGQDELPYHKRRGDYNA